MIVCVGGLTLTPNRLFRPLMAAFLATLSATLWAQHTDHSIAFTSLGIKDGLSQSSVFDIVQDQEGFLWFATEDGLNKYDGYRFTIYQNDLDRPDSILDNWVKAVFVDREGRLWVGTRTGLNLYLPDSDGFMHYLYSEQHLLENIREGISRICQDRDGALWIGSFAGGLTRFNPETAVGERFRDIAPRKLNDERVRAITVSQDGTIWVGSKNGLHELDPNTLEFRLFLDRTTPTLITHSEVRSLFEDNDGDIWIGTTQGLNRLNRSTGAIEQWRRGDGGLTDDWVNYIYQDPVTEGIWIATRNGGLNSYIESENRFLSFRANEIVSTSISSDNILSLYFDRSGVFWAGSYLAGISKFSMHRKPFNLIRGYAGAEQTLTDNSVRSLYRDHRQHTWAGTIDGLNELDIDMKVINTYRYQPGQPGGITEYQLLSIEGDKQGKIWIGTYGKGLNILDPETQSFEYYSAESTDPQKQICNDYVHDIMRDTDDTMWIGTRDGLQWLEEAENRFITAQLPDIHDSVLCLYQSSDRALWIGTYGQGLIRYDHQQRSSIRYSRSDGERTGLSSDYVTAVYEAEQGVLWVGTFSGLNRLSTSDQSIRIYDAKHGLPNAVIHGILGGDNGEIWFSTNRGLVQLKDGVEGPSIRSFDVADGLQGNEFLSGSAHQSDDGLLIFGGVNGFNTFYPREIKESTFVPPVVITSFRIFDQERQLTRKPSGFEPIVLHHSDKFISFEFAALDFTYPEKNQYRHKLEGFDQEWTLNNRRYISYSNLAGGNYVFRVQGSNHDGVWNEAGIALPIKVIPPFWERPWFIAVALLAFSGMIYWRFWDLRRQNTLLEIHVDDRTKDLKKAHDDLVSAQQQLVDTAHRAGMAEMATDILHNIGNALNSVYISAEMIQDHLSTDRLASLCRRLADRVGPQVKVNGDDNLSNALSRIADASNREREHLHNESLQIQTRVNHIKEIISAQQDYALMGPLFEQIAIRTLIDDALTIMSQTIGRWNIELTCEVDPSIEVIGQKSRLLQVIVNIVKNACEAMSRSATKRTLRITAGLEERMATISFEDSGHGIAASDLDRVFSHGYSNKSDGHGFGLHFCANAMTEMGGAVRVSSQGANEGATFTLEVPLAIRSSVSSA